MYEQAVSLEREALHSRIKSLETMLEQSLVANKRLAVPELHKEQFMAMMANHLREHTSVNLMLTRKFLSDLREMLNLWIPKIDDPEIKKTVNILSASVQLVCDLANDQRQKVN